SNVSPWSASEEGACVLGSSELVRELMRGAAHSSIQKCRSRLTFVENQQKYALDAQMVPRYPCEVEPRTRQGGWWPRRDELMSRAARSDGLAPQRTVEAELGRPRIAAAAQNSLTTLLNLVRTGAATTRQELERQSELGRAVVTDRLA